MTKFSSENRVLKRSNSFVLFNVNSPPPPLPPPNPPLAERNTDSSMLPVQSIENNVCQNSDIVYGKTVFDLIPSLNESPPSAASDEDNNYCDSRLYNKKNNLRRDKISPKPILKKTKSPSTVATIFKKIISSKSKSTSPKTSKKVRRLSPILKSSISPPILNPDTFNSSEKSQYALCDIKITSTEHVYEEIDSIFITPPLSPIQCVSSVPHTNPLIRRSNLMTDRKLGIPFASSTLQGSTACLVKNPKNEFKICRSTAIPTVRSNNTRRIPAPNNASKLSLRSRIIATQNIQSRLPATSSTARQNRRKSLPEKQICEVVVPDCHTKSDLLYTPGSENQMSLTVKPIAQDKENCPPVEDTKDNGHVFGNNLEDYVIAIRDDTDNTNVAVPADIVMVKNNSTVQERIFCLNAATKSLPSLLPSTANEKTNVVRDVKTLDPVPKAKPQVNMGKIDTLFNSLTI